MSPRRITLQVPSRAPEGVPTPPELAPLRRLAEFEYLATTAVQRASARTAAKTLAAAAHAAGWTFTEIAAAALTSRVGAADRVRRDKAIRAGQGFGVAVPFSPARLAAHGRDAATAVDSPWLRPRQAREYAGIGASRLYQWRREGLLPHCRPASDAAKKTYWLYFRPDLDRMIAARRGGKSIAYGSGPTLADTELAGRLLLPHPNRLS